MMDLFDTSTEKGITIPVLDDMMPNGGEKTKASIVIQTK